MAEQALEQITQALHFAVLTESEAAEMPLTNVPIALLAQSVLGAKRAAAAHRQSNADLIEAQVYVGLNDAATRKQEFDTNYYVSVLKQVCVDHGTPFSFDVINGGYIHDDGEYTEENTIVLTFIDVPEETVDAIARDLCALFHQESVLITTDHIQARTVRVVAASSSSAS